MGQASEIENTHAYSHGVSEQEGNLAVLQYSPLGTRDNAVPHPSSLPHLRS